MIYFRDISFCADSDQCANAQGCGRNFDDEQKAAAKHWWGSDDAPVAFMSYKNTCDRFEGIKNSTKGETP